MSVVSESIGALFAPYEYVLVNTWCAASCFLLFKALQLDIVHLVYALACVLIVTFGIERALHNGDEALWHAKRQRPILISLGVLYIVSLFTYAFVKLHPAAIYGCYALVALMVVAMCIQFYRRDQRRTQLEDDTMKNRVGAHLQSLIAAKDDAGNAV